MFCTTYTLFFKEQVRRNSTKPDRKETYSNINGQQKLVQSINVGTRVENLPAHMLTWYLTLDNKRSVKYLNQVYLYKIMILYKQYKLSNTTFELILIYLSGRNAPKKYLFMLRKTKENCLERPDYNKRWYLQS